MATPPRLLDDLARVASGAMGTVTGMRDEAEAQLRQRLERVLERMDVVPREEFEVARAMAAKARDEQEATAARLAALEAKVAELEKSAKADTGPAPASRKRTATKAASKGGTKASTARSASAKGTAAKTGSKGGGTGRGRTKTGARTGTKTAPKTRAKADSAG